MKKRSIRRLVLDDGIWRYRIDSYQSEDDWSTHLTLELRTPAGRKFEVPQAEVDALSKKEGYWHPIITPKVVREYIEQNRERI